MQHRTPQALGTSLDLLTLRDASRRSGISARQLEQAIEAGEVGVFAIGKWRRVSWHELMLWVQSRRRGGPGSGGPAIVA